MSPEIHPRGIGSPPRAIIHTVSPVWAGGGRGEAARFLATHSGIDRVLFVCFDAEAEKACTHALAMLG